MKPRPLYQGIASAVVARENCRKSGNVEWEGRWDALLAQIERDHLPSGSGIDGGTTIDTEKTNGNRIVLKFGFHHMDENGFYDGWTYHTAVITPSFGGIDIRITGRDRNQIKDYLHDTFYWLLCAKGTVNESGAWEAIPDAA